MDSFNGFRTVSLLNLDIFKIKKCNNNLSHNNIKFIFFHNNKDKRRNLRIINYNFRICKSLKNCENKNNCLNAHNKIENLYHPLIYKKKLCQNLISKGVCKFNKFCSFAHSFEELRIKLWHEFKQNKSFFLFYFKTEFCPLGNIKHDKRYCVYSHNFQDFKRANLLNTKLKECENWDDNNYDDYDSNCNKGFNCKYLHGWKEKLFHPENYKNSNCSKMESCEIKLICNKLHINEKKIQIEIPEYFMFGFNKCSCIKC